MSLQITDTFNEVFEMRSSRRQFLRTSAFAAAISAIPASASSAVSFGAKRSNAASSEAKTHDKESPLNKMNSSNEDDPHQKYYDAFYFKEKPDQFRFDYPFDGGILQEGTGYPVLGTETGSDGIKRLKIHVAVKCANVGNFQLLDPEGKPVPVNYYSGAYLGTVLLKDRISVLKARGVRKGKPIEITCRIPWAKNSFKRYRCYIDDHSFCFRDILKNKYKSIFDSFYFARLRELNRRYKTKFNLNCFNSTPERDFTLSMFPDCYKTEFEDNADWLRLAFHSENEFPPEAYRNAPPEKLAAEFDLTAKELKRIAGKAYSAGGLQIHFGMIRADSYKVLVDRGVKILPVSGSKNPNTGDKYCDFMLPNRITAYLRENQGWMDFDSGLVFYNGSLGGTEWLPVEQTEAVQHRKLDNPKLNQLVHVAGHEQYWWPFYKNHFPDIFERWDKALRHVTEHGYKPIWIDDGFFGGCE